jgi:hypothetical protein
MNAQREKIAIMLPREAHEFARLFAAKQPDVPTGKQVYLNTLAVYAIHLYLNQQGIDTDLDCSDSWYPTMMTTPDSADLVLPDLEDARVECRAVLLDCEPDKPKMPISESAWSDRIAYIPVGLGETLDRAYILGFFRPFDSLDLPEAVSIDSDELLPANDLPEYLRSLEVEVPDRLLQKVEVLLETQSRAELLATLQRMIVAADEGSEYELIAEYLRLSDVGLSKNVEAIAREHESDSLTGELYELADELVQELKDIWGEENLQKWRDRKRIVTSVPNLVPQELPILQLLRQGLSQIDQFIGWALGEFEPSYVYARGESLPPRYLTRQLKIAGQEYELHIFPPGTFALNPERVSRIDSTWRFQLRNSASGGLVPGGFKLRLLTETSQSFEGNQDEATTAVEVLYIDVTLEPGEGLIWETEPISDGYCQEILRF